MKTIIATLAFSLVSLVVSAQKKPVAKVYPGSVMMNTSEESLILTRNSGYSTSNAEVYLVKDAKSKVVAFYKKKAKRIMPCENGDQYLEMQTQHSHENETMSAGVVVSSNPYKKTVKEDIGGFNEMRELVKLKFHTQEEFDKVYERFKHLNKAFFNTTTEQDKTFGGYLNIQELLYTNYLKKANLVEADEDELETLVARIEQLSNEGKYEEVHEAIANLKNRIEPAAVQQTDTWNLWLEYFSLVEKEAFQSLVIIHKPFAQWPMENEDITVLQTR